MLAAAISHGAGSLGAPARTPPLCAVVERCLPRSQAGNACGDIDVRIFWTNRRTVPGARAAWDDGRRAIGAYCWPSRRNCTVAVRPSRPKPAAVPFSDGEGALPTEAPEAGFVSPDQQGDWRFFFNRVGQAASWVCCCALGDSQVNRPSARRPFWSPDWCLDRIFRR